MKSHQELHADGTSQGRDPRNMTVDRLGGLRDHANQPRGRDQGQVLGLCWR
jgi:hypothetical protein